MLNSLRLFNIDNFVVDIEIDIDYFKVVKKGGGYKGICVY